MIVFVKKTMLRTFQMSFGVSFSWKHIYLKFDKIWAAAWDFQHFEILTSVDSDEALQPPFKLKNYKWCSVSSLTIIVYSSDWHSLWSDCAYAQADLRLCWAHIPHWWKSHALAQMFNEVLIIRCTVLPTKSDSDVMFWLQSYQGLRVDRSLVY